MHSWRDRMPVKEMRTRLVLTAATLATMGMLASSCTTANAPAGSPASPARLERTKDENVALGRQDKTPAQLDQGVRAAAKGGQPLNLTSLPDWRGTYTRAPVAGFAFDPDTPEGG